MSRVDGDVAEQLPIVGAPAYVEVAEEGGEHPVAEGLGPLLLLGRFSPLQPQPAAEAAQIQRGTIYSRPRWGGGGCARLHFTKTKHHAAGRQSNFLGLLGSAW